MYKTARKLIVWSCIILAINLSTIVAQEPEKEPKLLTSYQDVLEVLTKDSVLHQPNNKKQSIRIPTTRKDVNATMVIRWQTNEGVISFVQSMPMEVPEERVKSLETVMMRLNHMLAIPGFAINHENRLPYYRLVIPLHPRGGIQDNEFRLYLQLTLKHATTFFGPLKQVAEEGADPVEVVNKILQNSKDRKAVEEQPDA